MAYRGLIKVTVLDPQPDGWWLFAFTADGDTFHEAVALLKQELPPYMRRWSPDDRCWRLSDLAIGRLASLFEDVQTALATLRDAQAKAREEANAKAREQAKARQRRADSARASWSSSTTQRHVPSDVLNAFAALHLLPSAPPAVVKAAFRALAGIAHPDHGGAHDAMLRLNAAYPIASQWAEQHAPAQPASPTQKAGKAG